MTSISFENALEPTHNSAPARLRYFRRSGYGLRARRDALIRSTAAAYLAADGGVRRNERRRLAERLRQILTSNPRARHFRVGRIVSAFGDAPEPAIALFSAAAALDAPSVGYFSGAVTSALGAQIAARRVTAPLPRSLRRLKVPRQSLAALIHVTTSFLENAEGLLRPRWSWASHPAMRAALGVLIILLGLAYTAPAFGFRTHHAASAFFVAVGLAERDGVAIIIGAIAGIVALCLAATSFVSSASLWSKIKEWVARRTEEIGLGIISWFANKLDPTLGLLLDLWRRRTNLLFSDETVEPPLRRQSTAHVPLRRRADLIRHAEAERHKSFGATMSLEQFYVFDVDHPLTEERKRIIEQHIDENASAFGKDVTHSWHERDGDEFLRIIVDPVTIEIAFHDDKVELYGAAPIWARLLFTASHKAELKNRIEEILLSAGFVTEPVAEKEKPQKLGLFAKARKKYSAEQ